MTGKKGDMTLILTMAGRDFRSLGFVVPKYLLPWGDRTILHAILSAMTDTGAFSRVFLVASERDYQFAPHVRMTLASLGIPEEHLFLIPETRGQVDTALVAAEKIFAQDPSDSSPVAFHNIDTLLGRRDFHAVRETLGRADAYLDVFTASNPEYSYVLNDDDHNVTEIAEKVIISNHATSGFYGFKNLSTFIAYARMLNLDKQRYISDVYRRMLASNASIKMRPPSLAQRTVVLSTPEEYLAASIKIADFFHST